MKITNNLEKDGCEQWVQKLVCEVVNTAHFNCKEIIIEDFDIDHISLIIDGIDYIIRTWDIHVNEDKKPCITTVHYTLFEMVNDEDGGHGEEVITGTTEIERKN